MARLIRLLTIQEGSTDASMDERAVPPGTYAFLTGRGWWDGAQQFFTAEDRDGVILTYLVEGEDFERVSVNLNFDHEAAPGWVWWERERFEAIASVAFLDALGRTDLETAYAEFCADHDAGADQATLAWSKAEDAAFAASVQPLADFPSNFTFNMAP